HGVIDGVLLRAVGVARAVAERAGLDLDDHGAGAATAAIAASANLERAGCGRGAGEAGANATAGVVVGGDLGGAREQAQERVAGEGRAEQPQVATVTRSPAATVKS